MIASNRFCTFSLDGLFFGVEVEQVQEVLRYQEMTRVPLASRVVRGLINLRGQIVAALDLRRRLGLAERSPDQLPMNVVIRTDEGPLSLLVDDIEDVLEVDRTGFESAPETLNVASKDLIHGVYKLENRLLHILDTAKAVNLGTNEA